MAASAAISAIGAEMAAAAGDHGGGGQAAAGHPVETLDGDVLDGGQRQQVGDQAAGGDRPHGSVE